MQAPSFDSWTILFLFVAFQGLVTGIVFLFLRRGNRSANRLMGLLLLAFSLCITEFVFFWTRYLFIYPFLARSYEVLYFVYGPLFYLYFVRVSVNRKFRWHDLLHFIPFIVLLVLLIPWFTTGAETKLLMMAGRKPWPAVDVFITQELGWARIGHLAFYGLAAVLMLRKAGWTGTMRKWSILLIAFYFGFVLSNLTYSILVNFPFFNPNWDYMISICMSLFIFFVAVFAYLQPQVFEGYAISETKSFGNDLVRYRNSGLTPSAADELLAKLDEVMKTEQLYLKSDLRLDILASRLGTTRHNLSQIINEKKSMNFFEYVNSLRVAEAQKLLSGPEGSKHSIIDIAYMSGFNNKVSFNSSFKKITGKTPTEYRKNIAAKETI